RAGDDRADDHEEQCPQAPPALPGPRARRLRGRRRRRAHALRALRGEAPAGERQPPPRRGRPREGLADGPAAAPAGSPARDRRPRVVARRVGHRRRDRARGRPLRHRLGRQLRAGRGLMATFTPREIVSELDRYIVGQRAAKRAVAIALRNRWRRLHVPPELRDEIAPKNIIMIGPTGVGKTEVSRRLAKLAQAPFIKVEASKFTEVGYVGRDVESIIRDLTELAINMVREEEKEKVRVRAREQAEERVLDLLLPP